MTCLECANLNLQAFPAHARAGFGRCQWETMAGVFESITHEKDCGKFRQATPEVIEARTVWANRGK
jgi:hypothetical protein